MATPSISDFHLYTGTKLTSTDWQYNFQVGVNYLTDGTEDITAKSFTGDGSGLTSVFPVGVILPYGGAVAPTGWHLCDGTSLVRTGTYGALFTAIGTAYGAADGSHFNLPDLRGRFLRGTDNGAGNDPDAATRTAIKLGGSTGDAVGSLQTDAFQGHKFTVFANGADIGLYASNATVGGLADATFGGSATTWTIVTDGTNGTPRVTTETRPKNVNVNYIIKTI